MGSRTDVSKYLRRWCKLLGVGGGQGSDKLSAENVIGALGNSEKLDPCNFGP